MSTARDIRPRQDDLSTLATSPSASFHSPSSHSSALNRTVPVNAKHLKPFATEDIKVLLLENVNETGRQILSQQGYQVEFLKSSLPEDQLIEKIRCVGCLCNGTNFTLLTRVTVTCTLSVFAQRPSLPLVS